MTGAVCAVDGDCRGKDLAGNQIPPRDVWDGGYLCGPCRKRLARWIAELPSQYDDLTARLSAGSGASEKVKGTRSTGLDLNEPVAAARDHLRGILCGWARVVCEERGVTPPKADDPHTVAAWLGIHVDWIAHQPFAAEPYREVAEIRSEAWRLANPSGRRRFAVAACPASDCTGTLHANLSPTDDLFPSALLCDTCEYELESKRWLAVLVKGRAA